MKKRFLALLLVLALVFASLPMSASAAEFSDVPAGAWYHTAVSQAVEQGLFSGVGGGKFEPGRTMNRAEFVTVLANFTTNYDPSQFSYSSFSDVPTGKWYFKPVQWASRAGITSGTGDGKFSPAATVTREQIVTMFYLYAQAAGNDTAVNEGELSRFSDSAQISNYARSAMAWAVGTGIINGSDGKLNPQGQAKRCEVAQIFVNALGAITSRSAPLQPAEEKLKYTMNKTVRKYPTKTGFVVFEQRETYPVFYNASNAEFLNKEIEGIVNHPIPWEEYSTVESRTEMYNKASASDRKTFPHATADTIEVLYNDNGYLSFLNDAYMWLGGMHAYHSYVPRTYDLTTNKLLSCADILKGTQKEQETLVQRCAEKAGINAAHLSSAALAVSDNAFALTETGLRFYLWQGDAMPRFEVNIPYNEKVFKNSFRLAK